jgi:predicted amidophosphoribosyltransferase
MASNALADALALVKQGHPIEGAGRLDQLRLTEQQRTENAALLAEAYYRRGLWHHAERKTQAAISDLEKALNFPGLVPATRSTIQARMTSIQKAGRSPEIRELDARVEEYFEGSISTAGLLGEFMAKYRLSKPQRDLTIHFLDAISSVSVYRWQGDQNYGETWTKLIRQAKSGERAVITLLSRILAEHFRATASCMEWMHSVDFVVPVPADRQRAAERHIDVIRTVAEQFAQRLGLPLRADLLRRSAGSERSRHLSRGQLAAQYTFEDRKSADVRGRTVLLVDDVVTRGFTASVCAQRLKAAGAARVYLLTLAQAESTHKEQQHFGESLDAPAHDLAPWLCLADTEKLGPVRVKSLLSKFTGPAEILKASEAELRGVQDIGPKLATAIVGQAPNLGV